MDSGGTETAGEAVTDPLGVRRNPWARLISGGGWRGLGGKVELAKGG